MAFHTRIYKLYLAAFYHTSLEVYLCQQETPSCGKRLSKSGYNHGRTQPPKESVLDQVRVWFWLTICCKIACKVAAMVVDLVLHLNLQFCCNFSSKTTSKLNKLRTKFWKSLNNYTPQICNFFSFSFRFATFFFNNLAAANHSSFFFNVACNTMLKTKLQIKKLKKQQNSANKLSGIVDFRVYP